MTTPIFPRPEINVEGKKKTVTWTTAERERGTTRTTVPAHSEIKYMAPDGSIPHACGKRTWTAS